jgi:hypothetical protein
MPPFEEQPGVAPAPAGDIEDRPARRHEIGEPDDPLRSFGSSHVASVTQQPLPSRRWLIALIGRQRES